jgi:hypothetical protein
MMMYRNKRWNRILCSSYHMCILLVDQFNLQCCSYRIHKGQQSPRQDMSYCCSRINALDEIMSNSVVVEELPNISDAHHSKSPYIGGDVFQRPLPNVGQCCQRLLLFGL